MKIDNNNKLKEEKINETGLEEQSPLANVIKNFKDSIFNVLFVLLDKNSQEGEETLSGLVFESGLDYLQMMVFPFQTIIIIVWNGGDTLKTITNIISKLNVSTYMPSVNFSTFIIVVYILILSIIMVILDIIYVSYSFSKKKFRFTWPLVLLAQIVPLFVTVLFLPITETLLQVVACQVDPESGVNAMQSFPSVVCWQGWHLFHSILTLLFTSIFVFISSVVALAMFEPRMSTNKLTARQNSKAQVIFILNKISAQFVFSFTPFDGTFLYVLMLFLLSGWLFYSYNMNQPYYNKNVGKFYRITSTYYFWTNCMLMVSQLLLSSGFNGGLAIWISGLPFIWMIIVYDKQSNIDKLFSSNLKFRTGEELESHLKYVLQLIQNQKYDKNSYMLLIGYIEKHKEICTEEDCPLKQSRKKVEITHQMEENAIQLIQQLERMYINGIKKYPSCTKLRLSFAFFYLERTKNKKKAYEEFNNAGKTQPAFEEEFIVYRFRKIIRENLENSEENEGDLIEIIRFDNHISLLEEGMHSSAWLHKQFWMELKEEVPDLKKLNSVGSKITQTLNIVRENYLEIEKIKSNVAEVLYSYSLYLMMVQQEIKMGGEYLQNAKKIYQENILENKLSSEIQLNIDYFSSDIGPMILVSGKEDSLGKIEKVNLRFMELLGYTSEEICDRHLERIMPDIFNIAHQNSIRSWINDSNISHKYFGGFNTGYLKHKSGFIIPVRYKVCYLADQEIFLTIFKSQPTGVCYLITDAVGVVKDVSAKAFAYFELDKFSVETKEVNIKQLGILKKRQLSLKKQKVMLQLGKNQKRKYLVKVTAITIKSNINEENQGSSEDQLSYHLENTNKLNNIKTIGYSIAIERDQQDNNKVSINKDINQQCLSQSSRNQDVYGLYDGPNVIEMVLVGHLSTLKKGQSVQFFDFGKDQKIKTMRLINNEIKMVYNQDSDDYYNHESNEFFNQQEYQLMRMDDESYQRKIKKAINTNLNHIQVTKLRWLSFVYLLLLFGLLGFQLFITIKQMNRGIQYGVQLQKRTNQYTFLTEMISETFQNNNNRTHLIQKIKTHKVEMVGVVDIDIILEDQSTVIKNLRDATIYIEGRLIEYFQFNKTLTLLNIYRNFIDNFFIPLDGFYRPNSHPTISGNLYKTSLNLFYSQIMISFVLFLSILMTVLWIIIILQINKKKFDIMIWFLDIPVPYVRYLGNHCDKYLKSFLTVKQLKQKGINFEEEQIVEAYSEKKDQTEEQVQEQQKARKTLIARHKKQTLTQKLDASYIKFIWLIIYSSIYSIVLISVCGIGVDQFNFLQPSWNIASRSILWGNSIQIALRVGNKYPKLKVKTSISSFRKAAENKYLNQVLRNGASSFFQKIFDYNNQEISTVFTNAYFQNMCGNNTDCAVLLDGCLQGGYVVYSKYLTNSQFERVQQIRISNNKYATPALMKIVKVWKNNVEADINKSINLSFIIFYLYCILTILGFLIGWLMYLKTINTDMNQTIQMLNMIPLKLLPKSRKQTRQFIAWIIKQANQKQHDH